MNAMLDTAILLAAQVFPIDPAWQSLTAPPAEMRSGKIKCDLVPGEPNKCEAMTWWEFGDNASIMEQGLFAINNDPPLSVAGASMVSVEGGAICGIVTQADIDGLSLRLGKHHYDTEAGQKLLTVLRDEMASLVLNKKVCSYFFKRDDGGQLEVVTIDGVFRKEFATEFRWIADDEDMILHAPDPLAE